MKNLKNLIIACSILISGFVGCATGPSEIDAQLAAFQASNPQSILVVPAVNRSLYVEAPNYFLSSLPIPIANKGYYVFPVNTVKMILEQEGLYEAEQVYQLEAAKLAGMFGADAILYVTIVQWTATYVLLAAQVTVEVDYRMIDKENVEIWKAHKRMVYTPQRSNSNNAMANLITDLVVAAATRAAPNYMPLVNQANTAVFFTDYTALPSGPYLEVP